MREIKVTSFASLVKYQNICTEQQLFVSIKAQTPGPSYVCLKGSLLGFFSGSIGKGGKKVSEDVLRAKVFKFMFGSGVLLKLIAYKNTSR